MNKPVHVVFAAVAFWAWKHKIVKLREDGYPLVDELGELTILQGPSLMKDFNPKICMDYANKHKLEFYSFCRKWEVAV